MFDRTLKRMREMIRTREYIVTLHAEEEREADDLSVFDIENCILSGEIKERQRDESSREWKYRIVGKGLRGKKMEIIARIGSTGKLIIITVYSV